MKQRVAITGIGAITPIGNGVEGSGTACGAGTSAVRHDHPLRPVRLSRARSRPRSTSIRSTICPPKRARRLDRFSQFALVCAQDGAGRCRPDRRRGGLRRRAGVYIGSALGGVAFAEEQHESYVRNGPGRSTRCWRSPSSAAPPPRTSRSSSGLTGPSLAYGNSCAAGLIAIGEAARLIEDGRVPVMLAGGAEAPLAPLTFGAFAMIRVLSTRNDDPATASRPFDRDRDGFVMAEGGAVLVLESFEHALARGAHIYAELVGYGTTNDAHHMTAPHPDGIHAARAHDRGAPQRRAAARRRSTTSTPTAPRPCSTTRPSAGRSGSRSASTPSASRSAARRGCTATPSARPARWRRRSAPSPWNGVTSPAPPTWPTRTPPATST